MLACAAPATGLSSSSTCGATYAVGGFGPGAAEDGYWVVVRLPDPTTQPFTVEGMEYTLAHGGSTGGNAGLAHDVAVYKSTTTVPASGLPTVFTTVPALGGVHAQRLVQVTLANSVQINVGEHVFAAIKLRYTAGPNLLCVGQCFATPENS